MIVLVDSDILIEVLRGRDIAIVAAWNELSESDDTVVCSVVSVAEIKQSVRPREESVVEALFAALPCVPVERAIAELAGTFLRRYRKSHGLELGDVLIAASAALHGAKLWTRNRKHYPMPELELLA